MEKPLEAYEYEKIDENYNGAIYRTVFSDTGGECEHREREQRNRYRKRRIDLIIS